MSLGTLLTYHVISDVIHLDAFYCSPLLFMIYLLVSAVKTAMNMFMHDKSLSAREKELLRSVKASTILISFYMFVKLDLTSSRLL